MNTAPPPRPLEETVAIVGVGLIGGSLAAALKARRAARRVIGVGRNAQRLAHAKSAGLIDEGFTDAAAAAQQAQFTVVCTPVDHIVNDVRQMSNAMPSESLITDAGSVKATICGPLADLTAGRVTFIGSHPLAGSEKQGFEHASAELFAGRLCVITPTSGSPANQVERLHQFWQSLGMRTVESSPEQHDLALASTSHVPHAIAADVLGADAHT
ncbi:MAG: prephenate dehydrogenase/arogenate dehydrogenase family protein [Planctomycetaceae bacterium]